MAPFINQYRPTYNSTATDVDNYGSAMHGLQIRGTSTNIISDTYITGVDYGTTSDFTITSGIDQFHFDGSNNVTFNNSVFSSYSKQPIKINGSDNTASIPEMEIDGFDITDGISNMGEIKGEFVIKDGKLIMKESDESIRHRIALKKSEDFKKKIQENLNYHIKSRVNAILNTTLPLNEQIAIQTLREMITETEYRRYITHGFINILGEERKVYQIFRGRKHIKVWQHGELIEEYCINIKHDIKSPPTDEVIMKLTLIRANEDEFKKLANVYNMRKKDKRNLDWSIAEGAMMGYASLAPITTLAA